MYATQNCKNSIHIFFRFKQKKFLLSYGQTGAKEFKKFKKNTVQNDIKSEQEEAESGISVSFLSELSLNENMTITNYQPI